MPADAWSTAHPDQVELRIAFDSGAVSDAQLVVQTMTAAAEGGLAGVIVDHYGMVLEDQFEWLHQGMRNARRLSARS